MRFKTNSVIYLAALATPMFATGVAHAYLGGFELGDGYGNFLNEVTASNQGQFGLNNGGPGGSQVPITPGTGLWYNIAGTHFPTFSGSGTAYATGHSGYQYTGSQGLVITTGCDGWGGPALKYGYRLDSRDLNGISPAATANNVVNISFWTRTNMQGTGENGGVVPGFYGDSVSFVDSAGNVGFSVGALQPSTTTDFVAFNNTGTPTLTSIISGAYSRWDIKLNLASQTVTASYFDGFTSTSTTLLSNAPLAAPMADLDRLFFESTPGESNAKNWAVDDFAMATTVPAPASVTLIGVGAVGLLTRRRRR